jgi:hypothetical protein
MSSRVSRSRQSAFNRQSGLCYYCQMPLLIPEANEFSLGIVGLTPNLAKRLRCTAEHLVPRSAGGDSSSANIVAACLFCNQTRHRAGKVLSPTKYAFRVRKRISAGRWHPPELACAVQWLRHGRVVA